MAGTKLTLPELLQFNVSREIGTKYMDFGTLLLDDSTGAKIKNLEHHQRYAEHINTAILQQWLNGRGKQPVTWATLVEVLRDIELYTLADDIEAVKCSAGTKLTLPELLQFNVSREIGTKYMDFGTCLLDDSTGAKIKNLEHQHQRHAEHINTAILQQWLNGRGKQPVTWATLVEVLRDIELYTLADDIEAVKCSAGHPSPPPTSSTTTTELGTACPRIGLESVDGTTVLDEDDLRDVICAVADLARRWKDLGISLGLRKSDLDVIFLPSPNECLSEMLCLWLRQHYNVERFGDPTWRRLVEAVQDKVGGDNLALAQAIARDHPSLVPLNLDVNVNSPFQSTASTGEQSTRIQVDPPQITQHPPSPVFSGSKVRFTIADITGAGSLTYKWRRGDEDLSEGGGVSGTTTDTLTIASVGKSDGGKYTCVVTNVAGVTTTSNAVQLTVCHNWRRCLLIPGGIFILLLVLLGIRACCQLLDSEVPHNERPPFKYDGVPSLSTMRYFRVKDEHIDIAEKIGADYKRFGQLILNDDDGTKVNNIDVFKHGDPVPEILRQWRLGKGKKPVTWQTLVECLRATGLNVLADDIEFSIRDFERNHSEL